MVAPWEFEPVLAGPSYAFLSILAGRPVVDSNSTRTEPCVVIRPEMEGTTPVDAPKATHLNRCERIIPPSQEMEAGLKTPALPGYVS